MPPLAFAVKLDVLDEPGTSLGINTWTSSSRCSDPNFANRVVVAVGLVWQLFQAERQPLVLRRQKAVTSSARAAMYTAFPGAHRHRGVEDDDGDLRSHGHVPGVPGTRLRDPEELAVRSRGIPNRRRPRQPVRIGRAESHVTVSSTIALAIAFALGDLHRALFSRARCQLADPGGRLRARPDRAHARPRRRGRALLATSTGEAVFASRT
jgi:hypothetical protein